MRERGREEREAILNAHLKLKMTLVVFLKITQIGISTLIPTFPEKPKMCDGSVHSFIISSISQPQVRSEKGKGRTGAGT